MEIKGKYTSAKIFAESVEEEAMSLIYGLCNHPAFTDVPIRQMPDTHAGKGICIGFTAPLTDMVNPAHVGCDIGCTVSSIIYSGIIDKETYPLLEHRVRKAVPTGFALQPKRVFDLKDFFKFMNQGMSSARSTWPEIVQSVKIDEKYIDNMLKRVGMDAGVFYKSISSLGGGNHFLELGLDPDRHPVWTIHCGSRNFGMKVFKYWETVSKKGPSNKDLKDEINKIKATVERSQIHAEIQKLKEETVKRHPMGYLSGDNMSGYLTDLFFCQLYAAWNHQCIRAAISKIMLDMYGAKETEFIQSVHNYINPTDHIIRKGAISSYEGQKMIIPFNMRDGLAICTGKSNPDWNYSAPHGAGRIMSRSKAKSSISVEDFKASMEGIYSTCIGTGTLDESPMAYKPMDDIVNAISETCDILYFVKPEINIKASESADE